MARRPSNIDAQTAHLYLAGSHTPGAYALAIDTAASAALTLPEGLYKVWFAARTATTTIFLAVGAAATKANDATVDAGVFGFPGDETVYVQIKGSDGTKTLNAIPSTGTGTLYVVGL